MHACVQLLVHLKEYTAGSINKHFMNDNTMLEYRHIYSHILICNLTPDRD